MSINWNICVLCILVYLLAMRGHVRILWLMKWEILHKYADYNNLYLPNVVCEPQTSRLRIRNEIFFHWRARHKAVSMEYSLIIRMQYHLDLWHKENWKYILFLFSQMKNFRHFFPSKHNITVIALQIYFLDLHLYLSHVEVENLFDRHSIYA